MQAEVPHLKFPFARMPELANYALNPSVEYDTPAWSKIGTTTSFGPVAANAEHGVRSQRMAASIPNSGATIEVYAPTIQTPGWVEAGEQWTYTLKVNVVDENGGNIHHMIGFVDANNNVTLVTAAYVNNVLGERTLTVTGVAPAGTVRANAQTRWWGVGAGATTVDVYMDAAQLVKGPAAGPYADGDSGGWFYDADGVSRRISRALVAEQDSPEHVLSCENVIVRCPVGFRLERPEYGVPWPEYQQEVDSDGIMDALNRLEPRSRSSVTQVRDLLEAAQATITVEVEV